MNRRARDGNGCGAPEGTFGAELERTERNGFVGRAFELSVFRTALTAGTRTRERILNLYGPGGIGKTALLAQYRRSAGEAGAFFVTLDMRDMGGDPSLLCREAAARLGQAADTDAAASSAESLADALNGLAETSPVVLAFDRYEEAGAIDEWLRKQLFPALSAKTLIVVAGRYPLRGPWSAPEWKRLTLALPVGELDYTDVCDYLDVIGLQGGGLADALWLETSGNPLGLSLLAQLALARQESGAGGAPPLTGRRETLDDLLAVWLEEAPDDRLRTLLYAASIPRAFDLELLNAMTGAEWPDSLFDRLIGLSFVRRAARGWQLHDLVRESVRHALLERLPETYVLYRDRAVAALRSRTDTRLRLGLNVSAEMSELLTLVGNPILRAHFRHSRSSDHYWETVNADTLDEAEAYVSRRLRSTRSFRIACSDPDSGAVFRYELSAADSALRLQGWNVRELHALDPQALRLLRSPSGDAAGLAAVVRLAEGAVALLRRTPVAREYIEVAAAELPAERGWFVLAMDVEDMENVALRSALVHHLLDQALAGALLVSAPPPLPYYRDSHAATGYRPIPGAISRAFGDAMPAPVYMLDTRSPAGMQAFLDRVIHSATVEPSAADSPQDSATPTAASGFTLTPREREVAQLLVRGATNGEIAAALFISEAAVKKHINAMLHRTARKNRTQLAAVLFQAGFAGE